MLQKIKHKSLCSSCFYQEKTQRIYTDGICIKCGGATFTINGSVQIPKPTASKTEWRAWIDLMWPLEEQDPFRRAWPLPIIPDKRKCQRAYRRATMLAALERKKS